MAFTTEEKDLFTSLGVAFEPDGETIVQPETETPAVETPATETPPDGGTPDPDEFDKEGEPATDGTPADTTPPATAPVDKSGNAFAQMRVENNQLKKTLEGFAALLGIQETKDTTALAEAVKSKVLEAQAAKDKIPVEYLQKIDRLETLESHFTEEQLRTQAALGFQRVIDRFKIDQTALNAFVEELTMSGVNPLTQPVDLVKEYQTRHFDDLVKLAEDRGRQEEALRAAKASEHGSVPGTQSGGKPGDQDKITAVKDLDRFFADK